MQLLVQRAVHSRIEGSHGREALHRSLNREVMPSRQEEAEVEAGEVPLIAGK